MPLTPRQYKAQLERAIRSVGKLDAEARTAAVRLVRQAKQRVDDVVARTDFSRYSVEQTRRALGDVMGDFRAQYNGQLNGLSRQTLDLVRNLHDGLRKGSGQQLGQPVLTIPQLEILTGFRTELIQKATDETIGRVSNEITVGVLAGKSPHEIQQAIRPFVTPLRRRDGTTTGILSRVETISRTEIGRAFNLANEAQARNDE